MVTGKQSAGADPSLSHLLPTLAHVLGRCLAKDPADRWQAASDVKRELEWVSESRLLPTPGAASKRSRPVLWTLIATAVLGAVAALAVSGGWFRRPPEPPAVSRFLITAPDKNIFGGFLSLSPAGRRLAFTSQGADGRYRVWIRPLDSVEAWPLAESGSLSYPFWSPDGSTRCWH
jgi:eukaryotic-like serine/threonine-protein kinase